MIPELRDLSCEERLKECGLTTLETRFRVNKIEVFKIYNHQHKTQVFLALYVRSINCAQLWNCGCDIKLFN